MDIDMEDKKRTTEEVFCELFGFTKNTYYVWKKDKKPVIEMINKYLSKEDLVEYLDTGKITKLEVVNNFKRKESRTSVFELMSKVCKEEDKETIYSICLFLVKIKEIQKLEIQKLDFDEIFIEFSNQSNKNNLKVYKFLKPMMNQNMIIALLIFQEKGFLLFIDSLLADNTYYHVAYFYITYLTLESNLFNQKIAVDEIFLHFKDNYSSIKWNLIGELGDKYKSISILSEDELIEDPEREELDYVLMSKNNYSFDFKNKQKIKIQDLEKEITKKIILNFKEELKNKEPTLRYFAREFDDDRIKEESGLFLELLVLEIIDKINKTGIDETLFLEEINSRTNTKIDIANILKEITRLKEIHLP